jgi:hypothetical protein
MTFTCRSKFESSVQSDVSRCKLHVAAVDSVTKNMKIIVKFSVESFDHWEGERYYWSHLLVIARWFAKLSEVEVELIHIKADRVVDEVVVGEI